MTRISVEGPRVEANIAADDVVAYLLREGWRCVFADAWVHDTFTPVTWDTRLSCGPDLQEVIEDIARAESRPAADVLADIVGPVSREAAGNGSAVCAVGMDGPWLWGGCRRTERCKREAPTGAEVE